MALTYAGNEPTEDGVYLVRAIPIDVRPSNDLDIYLTVGEYTAGYWDQLGIDFDAWTDAAESYLIEVICKLDLPKIAMAAGAQE